MPAGMRDFQSPGRSLVYAANGLCATSHPLAAQVAVRMLQDGGNAVDAGIAAAVLLGFCEPASTGLGGDAFALLKPPGEERLIGLNGSGRAPAGLDAARLRAAGHAVMPARDAAAVTVPGAVDAFVRLAADWGRLGLAASLAPAIAYAEAGVPVAPRAAFDWANARGRAQGRRARLLPARRAPVAGRGALPRAGPGRGAAAHRPRGPRRLLRGRGRRGHGRLARARSAARTGWRTSPPAPATTSSRSPATTAGTSSSSCRRTARARRRS